MIFLPTGLNDPKSKEDVESSGPLSLLHKSMVRKIKILVSMRNNRKVVGFIVAYDRHYNLLLSDAKEMWIESSKNRGRKKREGHELSRTLGNVFVRGDGVILVSNMISEEDQS